MRCKLGEIVDVIMGQSPKSEYYNSNGEGIPFLQGNRTFGRKYPTFDTYTTMVTRTANSGDVIMSVRAPVGDLNITPVDMCLGRGVCSLRMKNGNQEFLYYLMKYYVPKLVERESGTVFGSVNRNDINGLEIDVPDNIEIQNKIADFLAQMDEKIELNESINNNLSTHSCIARIVAKQRRQISQTYECLHTYVKVYVRVDNEKTAKRFSSLQVA